MIAITGVVARAKKQPQAEGENDLRLKATTLEASTGFAYESELLDLHFNLLRFRFLALRQEDHQEAVLELREYLGRVDECRQREVRRNSP